MKTAVYIHGRGGSAAEASHYAALLPEYRVLGFDYKADSPMGAAAEYPAYFAPLCRQNGPVTLIANSIGAYFAMHALDGALIERSFLISPVVDMEKLITGMMRAAGITETELQTRGEIPVFSGETLSWEYLRYVRGHPLCWNVPTEILYGENDALTDYETVSAFAKRTGARLTVMPGGEHWFHTEEQMDFLDRWLKRRLTRHD